MRKLFHCLFIASTLCMAQEPLPAISFENAHHSFGTILDGQKASHKYGVTNRGNAALQIREIRPSCGCSYTAAGKMSLEPGESTYIDVQFDPTGITGTVHKYIEVISNDPASPNFRLTFEASVIQEIMPSAAVAFLNNVPKGGKASSSIRLRSGNGRPVEVTGINVPDAPWLSCAHTVDGLDAVLNIEFDGALVPAHQHRGAEMMAVQTSSKAVPELQFPVQWNIASAFIVAPAKVIWSEAAGKELTRTVTLKNTGGKAFRILGAASSSPFIKAANISPQSGVEHKFDVVFSAQAKAGGYNEILTLELDAQEQRTFEVAVAAVLK